MRRPWILMLFPVLLIGCSSAMGHVELLDDDVEPLLQPYQGCFALYDVTKGVSLVSSHEACAKRVTPCSTFKIMNALAGLSAGVLQGEDTMFQWDKSPQPFLAWEHDHTLASAIAASVVWYFQAVAKKVGAKRMQGFLDAVGYGNRNISGGIDRFWLSSSLEISPLEQLAFLHKLYTNALPFSKGHMDIVKRIIVLETTDEYELSGKTGSAFVDGLYVRGWFVGRVATKGGEYLFATTIFGAPGANGGKAKAITRSILAELDILPAP